MIHLFASNMSDTRPAASAQGFGKVGCGIEGGPRWHRERMT